MKRFYYLYLVSSVCISLNGMHVSKTSFIVTLLCALKENNNQQAISEDVLLSAIPVIIPAQEKDVVSVEFNYSYVPYAYRYIETESSPPYRTDVQNVIYKEIVKQKTEKVGRNYQDERTSVSLIINNKKVIVPCKNDEIFYAYVKDQEDKPELFEFVDTEPSEDKSIVSNTQRVCLGYLKEEDPKKLREAIRTIQCFDFNDTPMLLEEIGKYKNEIIQTINNKINILEKQK